MSDDDITWTNEKRTLGELEPWPRNPRQIRRDQAERLVQSFEDYGQVETLALGPNGEVYNGHQRLNVLMDKYGPDYEVDVRVASRALSEKERERLTVFLHHGAAGEWDWDLLANDFELDDLIEWGFSEFDLQLGGYGADDFEEEVPSVQPNVRDLPLDLIWTSGTKDADATQDPHVVHVFCCQAVRAGWMYGCRSTDGPCVGTIYSPAHRLEFLDCLYTDYDHDHHRRAVKKWRPKYATVRDIMSRKQCVEAGIAYYELEQILAWAEDLDQYAQHVIVIPKYDCLDQIPDKYVLGYSIPTSHGGTPLPIDAFRGRRVHLLGGSWKKQLNYLATLGGDVVSIDHNYSLKAASYGQFADPEGNMSQVTQDLGMPRVNNAMMIAQAISVGSIGYKVWELLGKEVPNQPDPLTVLQEALPAH